MNNDDYSGLTANQLGDIDKIAELERRVDVLEKLIRDIADGSSNIYVRVKADKYYVTIPLCTYLKRYGVFKEVGDDI